MEMYAESGSVERAFADAVAYNFEKIRTLSVKTPDEKINHIMNLCHAKAVNACHEMVEGGKIGPVPGCVPIYPETCRPEDQIAAMNAEEFTEKFWIDTDVYGEYSNFIKRYWE